MPDTKITMQELTEKEIVKHAALEKEILDKEVKEEILIADEIFGIALTEKVDNYGTCYRLFMRGVRPEYEMAEIIRVFSSKLNAIAAFNALTV